MTVKLNNNVRKALALATTEADKHPAFDHFSYDIDWSNFPNSLIVHCHLKSDVLQLEESATNLNDLESLQTHFSKLVQLSLLKQGIKFRDFRKNFSLAC